MIARDLVQKYFDFFVSKGHKLIKSASLIPENDSTALFTSAGMHPLVPYLLGQPHPLGKRLVSVQKCLRTDDIDEVGNNVHHTFFQMLGNWSLGDYFKKEAISWSFEFLTDKKWLNIPKEKLAISVFAGDKDAPFDQESFDIWFSLGIPRERIVKLPKKNNWWGPVGVSGPCGPDSEMFYWSGKDSVPRIFDPEDKRWVEIWNDVFMEYNQKDNGSYQPLKQKNVDTGMGLERTLAVLNGLDDNYQTDLFLPIIKKIQDQTGLPYESENIKRSMRIIADHLRAAVFLVADGVIPSNLKQGYILRRLIRRAVRHGRLLNIKNNFTREISQVIINNYKKDYPELNQNATLINQTIEAEESKFKKTLEKGLQEISKIKSLDGQKAFYLYESFGFPLEMTEEIALEKGQVIDKKVFEEEFRKHQELSRTASAGMFKGGLSEQSEITTKYHTATHLLNASLRKVLGEQVFQKGSNITPERMRFDFPYPEKLTDKQVKKVENLVNEKIKENLAVTMKVMSLDEAKKMGAMAVFSDRYGDQVKVYSIGDFSCEVCGGPHVDFTGKLGKFKIIKEESAGAGIRRIYAILED